MKGIVIKSTGSWYAIRQEDGTRINCRLKGQFRIRDIKTTNPISVGDRVEYEYSPGESIGMISGIYERQNYIIRKSKKLSKVSHIIASNIDQAFLIATLAMPRTSTGFIDRFLVTAEAYHIPASIVFNKIDLYDDKLWTIHNYLKHIYSSVGYGVYEVSALHGDGIIPLVTSMKDRSSLFAGHSGVGKTALINAIEPALDLKTREISSYHHKGMHTTTFAEMYELSAGGFIIDTPGIKEFGLIDFRKVEVAERFPEMRALMHGCQFHNCTHVHEPKCAVIKALKEGTIDPARYKSYLSILNDEWDETDTDFS
ncbi:MAG: ribosome small subunit-dependent GTPase A [Bacteroidetes bacterium]|nr:ribosome small subunit-dependent GTPase A [Bacteroidota bacterium]